MALWSREELLSLSGWREGEVQRFSQTVATKVVYGKLFLRIPRLCVLPIGDKASLKGPVGKSVLIKMLSQFYSVHTYISSGHTIHSLSNVP